jgi:hypothetical protein
VVLHVADQHLVVHLSYRLDELLAAALRLFQVGLRDGPHLRRRLAVFAEGDGVHLHQVDHALVGVLDADRDLDGHRPRAQPLVDHLHGAPEVGADAVDLVHEADARDVVAVRLSPDGLRLALDTGDGIEYNNASVQDTEAALHFDGEVHVAGGVYDIDHVVPPVGRRGGGGDGDPPLPLLRHPVHDGSTGVHLTDLVGASRVEQDALGDRGLAGIDVRDDPNIPE